MIASDICFLCCPCCQSDLAIKDIESDGHGAIKNAILYCIECQTTIPVVDYIVVCLPDFAARKLLNDDVYREYSKKAFVPDSIISYIDEKTIQSGLNWENQMADRFLVSKNLLESDGFWGKEAFWSFCGLHPDTLKDKNICVYCGGSGREIYHLLHTQASTVFVVDIGAHLFNVPKLCNNFLTRMVLIMSDFYCNIIKNDIISVSICDHALQHIKDNRNAFGHIEEKTRPDGLISICVYSHENNFLMTEIVEPSKRILHKFDIYFIRLLAYFPAVILYFVGRFYCFVSLFLKETVEKFPYAELLSLWSKDGFKKYHEACYDLLHAPISYHFKKSELLEMAHEKELSIVKIEMKNKTMWTMIAKKAR